MATTISNHNQLTQSVLARLTNLSLSLIFTLCLLVSSITVILTSQTAKADTGITQIGQIGGYDSPPMDYPSSVALDNAGNIYIADHNNNRIQKLAPDGTFIAKWGANNGDGTPGTGNAEFNAPYGLALDTAGNVFVADSGNHRIQKLAPDGTFIAKWGANNGDGTQGSGDAEFNSPNGLVLDATGNVFVADSWNHRIQKLAPDGTFIAKWGANNGDGTQGSGNAEFNAPYGLALDTAGNFYVADTNNHRIQKLAPDGSFIAKWGALNEWTDLVIYTSHKYSTGGTWSIEISSPITTTIGPFPYNVSTSTVIEAIQASIGENVQTSTPQPVLETNYETKISWDSLTEDWQISLDLSDLEQANGPGLYDTGIINRSELRQGTGDAEFNNPNGLTLDSSGNIYVADTNNHRIQKLAPDGSFIAKWGANNGDGSEGSGNAELSHPNSIALDSAGNIYVADSENNRIQKLAPDGSYLTSYPTGYPIFSYGLAVDSNYNVYSGQFMYASYKPNNTLKFSATGQLTSYWPSETGFMPVTSVASSDALYTVFSTEDLSTVKLAKTSLDGTRITEWALPSLGFSLDLDSAGNIYYFDIANSKVIKYSSSGTVLAEYGTAGSGDGQISTGCEFVACLLALDSADNIYITDIIGTDSSAYTRLQKFSPNFDYLGKWEAPEGSVATGLVISPNDKVYLNFANESGSFLQKLTSNLSPAGEYLPTGEQAYATYTSPVATDNGRIYIVDFTSNQRINILCDNDESTDGCALPSGNNPGSQPSNVATIPTPTNADGTTTTPVTITTPTGTTITCSSGLNEATQSTKDASFQYPLGLVQFCFDTPNQNNTVNLTYITNLKPQDVVARKYNPNNNSYFNIENATITQTTIDNQPALSLTYTITDNGDLDLDPTLGKITDPVGLATLTTASPNTGLEKFWLLNLK
jgi:tripartite motif-containing protein 71